MYKGKEICQGCKTSGEINPREVKDSLCKKCNEALKLGRSIEFENTTQYTRVKDWYHGFATIEFEDKLLDDLATDLLKSLDNKDAEASNSMDFPRSQPHGFVFYKIPTNIATSLKVFLTGLNGKIKEIRKSKEDAELYAKEAVKEERNKIYNEGVSKGRQLLVQLNSGEITLSDLEKKQNY